MRWQELRTTTDSSAACAFDPVVSTKKPTALPWVCRQYYTMSIDSLIVFLLVGLTAGFLAGRLLKGSGFGLLGNLIIGAIGSILGVVLFGLLGLRPAI